MPEELKLVEATTDLEEAFREMAEEWRQTGEDRFKEVGEDFSAYMKDLARLRAGIDLAEGWAPTTNFWLVADGRRIVGTCRFRHHLLPNLENEGGHIGYDVRPSERGKGYGTIQLRMVLEEARKAGLSAVLVTCDDDNVASAKIIENNGGHFIDLTTSERTGKTVRRYRIVL